MLILKKNKIINVLHQCTKNYDHDHMFGCRDMTWDKQRGYFRMIFAFYPCSRSKNQNLKKYNNNMTYYDSTPRAYSRHYFALIFAILPPWEI